MSAKVMGQVWELELSTPQMVVLLAMADHADHNGRDVYPCVRLIAWKTSYSERQVQRIIQQLVKARLLIKELERPGKTTIYRIDLKAGTQKPPYNPRQNVTPDIPPSHSIPTPDISRTTPDIQMSPESFKPSKTLEPSNTYVPPALTASDTWEGDPDFLVEDKPVTPPIQESIESPTTPLSPSSGQPPSPNGSHADEKKPRSPKQIERDTLVRACAWAWEQKHFDAANPKTSGYANVLANFVSGRVSVNKQKSAWNDYKLEIPMDAVEVVALKLWWMAREETRDLSFKDLKPETINRRIDQFRGDGLYPKMLERAKPKLEAILQEAHIKKVFEPVEATPEPQPEGTVSLPDLDAQIRALSESKRTVYEKRPVTS